MNSSQPPFVQQWRAYIQTTAQQAQQIMAETQAGCRQMIASRPNDTLALGNALQAVHIKIQTLRSQFGTTFGQQVAQFGMAGQPVPSMNALEQENENLLTWIEESWLRCRAQCRVESLRAMWPNVQQMMASPVACTKCGSAIQPRLRHAPDTVECPHCKSVNQTSPDPVVGEYFAMAPDAWAESAMLEKRLEIDRFRAQVAAQRRANAPALSFAAPVQIRQRGADGREIASALMQANAPGEEATESMLRWESMEREYWQGYFAAKAAIMPSSAEEQAQMVESRMKGLIDLHFKRHQGWCKAKGLEGPVENARTPEMMSRGDEWGPLQPNQVEEFYYQAFVLDDCRTDPPKFREYLAKFGYRSNDQFEHVRLTFNRHAPVTDPNMMQMQLNARNRASKEQMAAKTAAAGDLLAPIEGVSLEQYAAISAQAANYPTPPEFQKLLAQHGLDAAKFDRVSKAWTDRMSKDTSMVVVNAYSKAFGSAGAGQYGAVAQAGVAAADGQPAAAAFNPASVSFETYCEIMGAQAAWSSQGKDVNAMLKKVFNMTALDYSNVSQYWSPKMMTDMSLAMKMSDLMMRAQQKYMAM